MQGDKVLREGNGRFSAGTAAGPGRPSSGVNELRLAMEQAVEPAHVVAIMRRLTRAALEGNLTAARIVLERACGRAAEAPPGGTPMNWTLPKLRSAEECNTAIEQLGNAVCAGTVDREAAKLMLDLIQARLKAIEVTDLEQRMRELESTAKLVQR